MYNISSLENDDSTKLVITVRAGGKPLAGITNSVLIFFWDICTYTYICIYIHIYVERDNLFIRNKA